MLKVRNLNKHYKNQVVIHDLSFSIRPGARVCIFAPSGAGKTTLIHILSGLDEAFTGMVETTARQRCTVFQDPGLFWYKTVAENIRYPLSLNRIPIGGEIRERYREWMAVTGLSAAEHRYPYQISGGMKQKTALVRAFLPHPDLVLLDEAFSWMDLESKQAIMAHIQSRYPETSLLMATHGLDEISAMAQIVMTFRERRLSRYQNIPISSATGFEDLARKLFSGVLSDKGC